MDASGLDRGSEHAFRIEPGGRIVAIGRRETLLATAPDEASKATGINGDESDTSQHNAGAAYVFTRAGATWTQIAYLKASNTMALTEYGSSAALSGDASTIVIGAPYESGGSTGVNGDQTSQTAQYAGAAYVFH